MTFKLFITALLTHFLITTAAHAACRVDPREVQLTTMNGNVTEPAGVRLKRTICSFGDANMASALQIEYNEYANQLASSIITGSMSYSAPKLMGHFSVSKNDVYNNFKYIVDNFSEHSRLNGENTPGLIETVAIKERGNASGSELINSVSEVSSVRIIDSLPDYPMFRELAALSTSKIPDNMNVYYETTPSLQAIFWRYGNMNDIKNYYPNIKDFNKSLYKNRIVQNYFNSEFKTAPSGDFNQKYLGLISYLGANGLPADFFAIVGSYQVGACASDGSNNWFFYVSSPAISLRSVVLTNKSNHPLVVDRLLVNLDSQKTLRAEEDVRGVDTAIAVDATIPANESLIVPTGIIFKSRPGGGTHSSLRGREVYNRLVSKHIASRPDVYAEPVKRDYVFGPVLQLKGIESKGTKVLFSNTGENLVDVSYDGQAGSCPYVLAWDDALGDWVSHGKILHEARNEQTEASQRVAIAGYVPRIRIEEREPEAATLRSVSILLRLADGRSIAEPHAASATTHLSWGEHADFPVILPAGVQTGQVVSTEVTVTGFYRRYSSIENASWKNKTDDASARPAVCLAPAGELRAYGTPATGR